MFSLSFDYLKRHNYTVTCAAFQNRAKSQLMGFTSLNFYYNLISIRDYGTKAQKMCEKVCYGNLSWHDFII